MDDILLLCVRSDYPPKEAVIKVPSDSSSADLREMAESALELKVTDSYEFQAVSLGTDVLALPAGPKRLVEFGVKNRSTILLIAPPHLRPARRLPSKKKKNDKDKRQAGADDPYAEFTPKNVIPKLESGVLSHKKEKLAREYLDIQASAVLKTQSFLEAKSKTVLQIVQSNTLNVKEVDLFSAVVSWGKAELKRQEIPENLAALKDTVAPMLPHIRFPLMTTSDVAVKVAPTNILSPEQILEVFTYLGASAARDAVMPRISFPVHPRKARTFGMRWQSNNLVTLEENATKASPNAQAQGRWASVFGDVAIERGQYEFTVTSLHSEIAVGFISAGCVAEQLAHPLGSGAENGWGFHSGLCMHLGAQSVPGGAYGASGPPTTPCRFTARVDLDASTIEFVVNGLSTGVAFRNVIGPLRPCVSMMHPRSVKIA